MQIAGEKMTECIGFRVSFAKEDTMGRFKFYNGNYFSGTVTKVAKRTPEEMAERKRLSALLRDAKRKLKTEGKK